MAKTILLVDDADVFLQVERMIFQRTGARLLLARSGAEALETAVREQPDIVLLDLLLPDMTGDQVCHRIKSHPGTNHVPVLIVTAFGRAEEQEKCRKAGCDGFITKPIKHHELLARVAQLLNIPHRHSMRILVRVEVEGAIRHESFFGTSNDISKSGMFLETDKTLRIGDGISVRFFLPGHQEVTAHGSVVREDRNGAAIGYGVQFETREPALDRFIESKAR